MFPQEIFRLLSLQLPPGTLAINKQLSLMYDDTWYEDYLQLQCPGVKLWKQTSYRDRYNKFLQSGTISNYRDQEIVQCIGWGIAAASINAYTDCEDMILNFNGELYMDNVLIDTQVIAIDTGTYITDNIWYCYDYYKEKWITIAVLPESQFLVVIYTNNYIYALTDQKIYYYDPEQGLWWIPFPKGKAMTVLENIYVLNNRREIQEIDISVTGKYSSEPFPIAPVDDLYSGGFKMQDGTNKCIFSDKNFRAIAIQDVPHSGKLKNIIASHNKRDNYNESFLLIDDKVYIRSPGETLDLLDAPILTKVRQIMGNWSGIYFIRYAMAPE